MRLKIVENKQIAKDVFRLRIDNPGLFEIDPGQFLMLKINDYPFPLLRRPFSIAGFGDTIDIIYKVVGEGTRILSKKLKGEFVDIVAPLGRGFSINSTKKIMLVGGGIGVAGLLYLKDVIEKQYKLPYETYFGFNFKEEVFVDDGNIATMDGSVGFKGNVVDFVADKLNKDVMIYACGPTLMLRRLAFLCFEAGCSMQVSLESRMACGIGVCLGCVILTADNRFKKVCSDGPVFDYEEIQWQAL